MSHGLVQVCLGGGEAGGGGWQTSFRGAADQPWCQRLTQPSRSRWRCAAPPTPGPAGLEGDISKVRQKLRKFLLRRPTLQSLREKGYIKGTRGARRAGRRWPRAEAALTSLSPRPGVRLSAGRAV